MIDTINQIILIINVKSGSSSIILLKTAISYYTNGSLVAEGIYQPSSTLTDYFKSIKNLSQIYSAYEKYGEQFLIQNDADNAEIKTFIENYDKTTFHLDTVTLEWWRFYIYALSKWTAHTFGQHFGFFDVFGNVFSINENVITYEFLEITTDLGRGNFESIFKKSIQNLLNDLDINSNNQLVGFLRIIEIISSINTSAVYNAIHSENIDLSQFLVSNSQISRDQLDQLLKEVPGLQKVILVIISSSNNGNINWQAVYNSFYMKVLSVNIHGLTKFTRLTKNNPKPLNKLNDRFKAVIKAFAKAYLEYEGSGSAEEESESSES